jgi:plasmid stability protein
MHRACILGYAECMDTTVVQVRDVPVEVVATLKARAEARGQSLAAYLRDLLAREAQATPIEDVMAGIASRDAVGYTIEELRSFASDGRR